MSKKKLDSSLAVARQKRWMMDYSWKVPLTEVYTTNPVEMFCDFRQKQKGRRYDGVGPGWVLRKTWLEDIVATEPPSAYADLFSLWLFNLI